MSIHLLPPEQILIRTIANSRVGAIEQLYYATVTELQGLVNFDALVQAIQELGSGRLEEILEAAHFSHRDVKFPDNLNRRSLAGLTFEEAAEAEFFRIITASGEAGIPIFLESMGLEGAIQFEAFVEGARLAAQQEVGTLITLLDKGGLKTIRSVIETGFETGLSPTQIGNRLEQVIGLDARRAGAYAKFPDKLKTPEWVTKRGPAFERGWRKRKQAAEYRRLIKSRGKSISRTEALNVARASQNRIWREAISQGTMADGQFVRIWVRIPAAQPCPICGPLDGARAPIGGYFPAIGGKGVLNDGPTAHTHCLCGQMLVRATLDDVVNFGLARAA